MSALILLIIAIRRDDDCVRAIVMQTFANTNITYERVTLESAVSAGGRQTDVYFDVISHSQIHANRTNMLSIPDTQSCRNDEFTIITTQYNMNLRRALTPYYRRIYY